MSRAPLSRKDKNGFHNQPHGEHKLAFAFNADGTKWYYRTKSGAWRNIADINIYGLRYILERLEKEGRQSGKIYHVISEELALRETQEARRRSAC